MTQHLQQPLTSVEDAKALGLPFFRFVTDQDVAIKALPDTGDGKKRVRLTASTSMRDLVGDTFTQKALGEMKAAAAGTTMFLNHKRQVPEDVFGLVERCYLENRRAQVRGKAVDVVALDYDVVVAMANPRAKQTYEHIEAEEAKLGASVTVAVTEKQKQASGPGDLIDGIYYLERSIVGIPMNPASFVQFARKSLELDGAPAGEDTQIEPSAEVKSSAAPPVTADSGGETPAAPAAADPQVLIKAGVAARTDPATIYHKGLFAEAMAKHKFSPWQLFDKLTTIFYSLRRLQDANRAAGVTDDFDYRAAINEAIDEFCEWLKDSAAAMFGLDDMQPAEVSSYSLELLKGLELISKAAPSDEAAVAAGMAQGVHDLAKTMGAACAAASPEASPPDGANKDVGELVTKNAQLEERLSTVSKELEEKAVEAETWKACSMAAERLLVAYGREPLPRAGVASVSQSQ